MRISDIDPNFRLSDKIPTDTKFRSVWEEPFRIYGIADNEKGDFCRLPRELLPQCSAGIQRLAEYLAGACIRFTTDADSLSVHFLAVCFIFRSLLLVRKSEHHLVHISPEHN